ncbi:MAG TPA: BON domain-containing protein [Blastocatellia bacterium]|nr:BON domain-containing protein [Blastocatellia bacterium]
MRRAVALVLLSLLIAGVGYYFYRSGWRLPSWFGSVSSSSADAATTGRVKAALSLSRRVSGFDIGVETEDGVVTLTGQVGSEDLKSLAGAIARDTEGVKEVRNEISVDPGAKPSIESQRVADLEIRTEILEAFARSPELGGKSIEVKVDDRLVTLSGTVENAAQRNGAEQTARAVDGVVSVTNNLAVTNPQAATEPPAPQPSAADVNTELAKRVEFELYRTGAFNTLEMKISAEDGAVTLSGTVRSRAEYLLAERITQATHGVQKVVNNLKVVESQTRK